MISVFIMTKMKGYGVNITDVWFGITLIFHTFVPGRGENLTLRSKFFDVPRTNLAGSGSS